MPDIIFLIGFMGSGKTTLGKHLAQALDWSFVDLDQHIEEQEQTTIAALFENLGEAGFRRLERFHLHNFALHHHLVLACGGGTPCFLDNMDWMLRRGLTVYLRFSPEDLYHRLRNATDARPLLRNKNEKALMDFIEQKLTERSPDYERAAILFDPGNRNETETLEALLKLIVAHSDNPNLP